MALAHSQTKQRPESLGSSLADLTSAKAGRPSLPGHDQPRIAPDEARLPPTRCRYLAVAQHWVRLDQAVEAWLLGDVAAAYDAMRANSEDVIETTDVRAHLAARRKA